MRRFSLTFIVPTIFLIVIFALPMIDGSGTLYYRDFTNAHLPMKAAHAHLMQDGHLLPVIDPYRSGGQPLLGNPNALPIYPSNVLFLMGSPLWAMNAHIWLHWLLAPIAFFWLGRAVSLSRPAAWTAGAIYATSGFYLSLFNLYNLIAAATLTPALIAACLEGRRGLPGRWPMAGALWGMIALGGDPLYAVLAAAMAFSALLLLPEETHPSGSPESGSEPKGQAGSTIRSLLANIFQRLGGSRLVLAFGLGTVLTLPMVVEMLRILPASFRGHWRYTVEAALSQSWNPLTAIEWVLPFFFGPINFDFWGTSYYGGNPPLLNSLYPGTLALVLVLVAGWPKRGRARVLGWTWGWMLLGGFLALGFFNPVMHWLYKLPGASALRYPVKVWLVIAIAGSLLAGLGLERSLQDGGRRLRRLLLVATGVYGFAWLLLIRLPEPLASTLQSFEPRRLQGDFFAAEHLRWTTTCFFVLLTAIAALIISRRFLVKPSQAAALLVCWHVLTQLFLMQPLIHQDDAEPYLREPELLASIAPDQRGVHGAFDNMFDGLSADFIARFPDRGFFWQTRETFTSMGHSAGALHKRRYELNHSPEGLDSFVNISLTQSMPQLQDPEKVRVLAASGVDRLFLHRPLENVAPEEASLVQTVDGTWTHYAYALPRTLPDFALATQVVGAPHLNAALETLISPHFDPRTTAVVRSSDWDGSDGHGAHSTLASIEVVEDDLERFELVVDSETGGVLVTRRAHLPIYQARIDDQPAKITVANVHKLGVIVPPGRHRVEVWVDRRPTTVAVSAALLAALALITWWAYSFQSGAMGSAGRDSDRPDSAEGSGRSQSS